MNYRQFRNRFRFIPFGKFSISGRGKSPFNQVYVGRGKERAAFIELLTNQEQFGAFLVSGRRGSGKTSFVEYALSEYEKSSFHRFIRFARNSSVQDFLIAVFLGVFVSTLAVILAETNELLAQNAYLSLGGTRRPFSNLTWTWIPLIFLIAPTAWLLMFAIKGYLAAMLTSKNNAMKRVGKFIAWSVCIIFFLSYFSGAVDVWLLPAGIGEHSPWKWIKINGFFGLVVALIFVYLAIASSNTIFKNIPRNRKNDVSHYIKHSVILKFILSAFIFVMYEYSYQAIFTELFPNKWIGNLLIFFTFLFVMYTDYIINLISENSVDSIEYESYSGVHFALYLLLFLILSALLLSGYVVNGESSYLYMIPLIVYFVLLIIPFLFVCARKFCFLYFKKKLTNGTDGTSSSYWYIDRPPIELALIIKSTFLVVLWVTISFPLIKLGLAYFEGVTNPELSVSMASMFTMDEQHIPVIFLFLTTAFYFEYDWIGRTMRTERQDSTIASLGRKRDHSQIHQLWPNGKGGNEWLADSGEKVFEGEKLPNWMDQSDGNMLNITKKGGVRLWMKRRKIARTIEKASLSYLFYNTRVPVITIWINLGFDDLKHARIIEAMLVQLRERYRNKFTTLSGQIGLATFVVAMLLVLVLTKHLAATLFHVGSVNQLPGKEIVKLAKDEKTGIQSISYCSFFERNPEVSPAVKSAICALPYNERLFRLLYSQVFSLGIDFTAITPNPKGGLATERFGELKNEPSATKAEFICLKGTASSPNGIYCSAPLASRILFDQILDRNLGLPVISGLSGDMTNREVIFNPIKRERNKFEQPRGSPIQDCSSGNRCQFTEFDKYAFPTLRVYHILLFFIVIAALRFINSIFHVLPYRERIAEMTRLIGLIRGRITYTNSDLPSAGWIQRLLGLRRRDETIETNPDPRIVEQSFIDLLKKITVGEREAKHRFWTMLEAKPEIMFVFDEMDKLSGKVDAEVSRSDEVLSIVEENTQERQRSLQLHRLLSDMKRLVSSDAARFIFIGGRLYHDEWLADQANRAPLLNSIFTGQIYLPSLLTDREHAYGRFNDRIAEFLLLMYRNARHRFEYWRQLRKSPAFFGSLELDEPTYKQSILPYSGHPRRLAAMAHHVNLRIYDEGGDFYHFAKHDQKPGDHPPKLALGEQETLEQLLNFLTYRSAGNPKKLKEMLQSLILPSSKAFALPRYPVEDQIEARWNKVEHHHDVILLDDHTIYRMQFIDILYRHLSEHLESRILERDDKVAMSLFYLMDFLMKFHNRGFSWTNLQRVDELSHIHRAPDLKSMMGLLVEVSSERFLHRVLNGVYSFRFRSDFSREIDYLSRISKEEMAALNFTLDESQSLKGLYEKTMQTGMRENVDTISGLGELYEYDQEFEVARNYYRRAISVLDGSFRESTGVKFSTSGKLRNRQTKTRNFNTKTIHQEIEQPGEAEWLPLGFVQQSADCDETAALIKANFSWAIARLRLMLQIGHTYEQEQNYERALGSYMHSHRFSQSVLRATVLSKPLEVDPKLWLGMERTVTGENYSILYQASLAAAWIFEKDNQDIDDSITHAEHTVGWLYSHNSILFREHWEALTKPNAQFAPDNSSVMLVASDMHDRVGDLYFYKGKQSMRGSSRKPLLADRKNKSLPFGYLLQAHYHYAMSIWNIRNYLNLRHTTSAYRTNILQDCDYEGRPTIRDDGLLPDMLHNSLGNSITDMSEAILARTSLSGLIKDFANGTMQLDHCDNIDQIDEAVNEYSLNLGESVAHFLKKLPRTKIGKADDALNGFDLFSYNVGISGYSKHRSHLTPDYSHRDENGSIIKRYCVATQIFGNRIEAADALLWLGMPIDGNKNIGNWPENSDTYAKQRTLVFKQLTSDKERLFAYIYFSSVAAESYKLGGYSIDAANEYLLQAETAISVLWSIRQLQCLNANGSNQTKIKVEKLLSGDAKEIDPEEIRAAQCVLGTMAINALRKAANLIQISYRPSASRTGQNHGDPRKMRGQMLNDVKNLVKQVSSDDRSNSTINWRIVEQNLDFNLAAMLVGDVDTEVKVGEKAPKLKELFIDTGELWRIKDKLAQYQNSDYYKITERYSKFAAGCFLGDQNSFLGDDYNMSQPWRDDPRILSYAASLILALVGEKTSKPGKQTSNLETEMIAQYVYDGFLQEHGAGLFAERPGNTGWLPDDTERTFSGLFRLCERYRFPVLNRLKSMKILLDAAIIHGPTIVEAPENLNTADCEQWKNAEHAAIIGRLVDEISVTADLYDSEMHFSPYDQGASQALAYLYCVRNGYWALYDTQTGNKKQDDRVRNFQQPKDLFRTKPQEWDNMPNLSATLVTREALGETSLNLLRRSEQIFSMGKAYYENITNMQYLNDDFNDRSVHYNHAKRMMFAEITQVLASAVHDELFQK